MLGKESMFTEASECDEAWSSVWVCVCVRVLGFVCDCEGEGVFVCV